jgi:MFS family permease
VAVSGSCGEGLVITAVPLLVLGVTTDPRDVSLVTVVGQLPWLLLSLVAGALIDAVPRRTLLAAAFAVQAVTALVLAAAAAGGWLGLPLLLAVSFVVVAAQVVVEGVRGAMVPGVVGSDRLDAANARMMVIDRGVVQFAAPPAAGLLVALSTGAPAWIAAVAALAALVLTRGLPSHVPVPRPPGHPLRGITDGLRFLVGSPLLRAMTVKVAIGSLAFTTGFATFVLYATEVLHANAVGYGLLLAASAAGWVLSSFVVGRLTARFGYSGAMRGGAALAVLCALALWAVPPSWPLVAAVLVLFAGGTLLWNVGSQSSRQRFTPPELLGRVLAGHRALTWSFMPVGGLLGGLVATHWGLRSTWLVAAAVDAAGLLLVWRALSPEAFERERTPVESA